MSLFKGKRYWLVGASEGLGAALAHRLSEAGAELIVSARSEAKLKALANDLPGPVTCHPIDVADDTSVAAAARTIGELDGVVYLAAVYWPMSATDWQAEHANQMADVNFTGLMRVLGEVVPGMVARNAGHVVITSSLTAFRGLPGSIGYTASKAATLSLAECLHADLRQTGVRVQVAIPGFIETRLTRQNDFHMPFLMTPEQAADHMMTLMRGRQFKKAFPRLFSWLFRGGQFLPDAIYYRLFSR